MRGQVLRRAQQHRGVAVVAAAVHAAADGGLVREAVVLGHGQRVHVGAQADGLAAAAAAQDADHAGFPQPRVDFQPPLAQALGHQVGGARFLEGQLGMGVDVTAQFGQRTVGAFDFG